MRIEASGSRVQDSGARGGEPLQVLHPESSILDPAFRRMRWRCRRGLLELDIVLGRFVEHYGTLDAAQRLVFDELLELPDNILWDMISGKTDAVQDEQRTLLTLINTA